MFPRMSFARLALLALVLVITASIGFGQTCRITHVNSKHSASITCKFDQRARSMRTVLEYPEYEGDGLSIYATFYHHDMKLGYTPSVELTFLFGSKQSSASHARDLRISLNGQPFALPGAVQYFSEKEGHVSVEAARITITYEKLLELVNGRRAEVQLGGTSRKLSNDNIEALRDLSYQLAPYAQWSRNGGGKAWVVR